MRNALFMLVLMALALAAAPVYAGNGLPGGAVIAQAPPPPPGFRPGAPPSPRAQALLQCNIQQAQCADNCNYRFFGQQRNLCYNQCNSQFVRCTRRANRLPY